MAEAAYIPLDSGDSGLRQPKSLHYFGNSGVFQCLLDIFRQITTSVGTSLNLGRIPSSLDLTFVKVRLTALNEHVAYLVMTEVVEPRHHEVAAAMPDLVVMTRSLPYVPPFVEGELEEDGISESIDALTACKSMSVEPGDVSIGWGSHAQIVVLPGLQHNQNGGHSGR